MCEGVFKGTGPDEDGFIYFKGNQNALKDIYFHPSDIEVPAAKLIDLITSWETDPGLITLHVASQAVLDKFNADEAVQADVSAGRLAVVKDIEAGGSLEDVLIKAKRDTLAEKISQGETMTESEYTRASWSVLQNALAGSDILRRSYGCICPERWSFYGEDI